MSTAVTGSEPAEPALGIPIEGVAPGVGAAFVGDAVVTGAAEHAEALSAVSRSNASKPPLEPGLARDDRR